MRILWFTNTPSGASAEFGYSVFGGGWISSLESLIVKEGVHKLGICFFYNGTSYKMLNKDGVNYYGIPLETGNPFKRILNRQAGKLNDTRSEYIEKVIADFKPDLIHVFGTEMGYGDILINHFDKVLFHLQGLMEPYARVYFPNGFNKYQLLQKSGLKNVFRGLTFYHHYLTIKKRAEREVRIVRKWKYFTGRTDWDRNYVALLNQSATYFHCEELLRERFFLNEWTAQPGVDVNKEIVIGTTINPNIYKGLDLVYKVLKLLKDYNVCWKIFGLNDTDYLNKVVKKMLKDDLKGKARVKFYGQIDAPMLIAELKTCHFFVHPSYIDNSPNSVCEAMLLGMPVLSSSVGGVKSLITHNLDGFLFNPYDKYDLAGLLVSLTNNYDVAIRAGQQARQAAMKRHSPTAITTTLINIYNTIYND